MPHRATLFCLLRRSKPHVITLTRFPPERLPTRHAPSSAAMDIRMCETSFGTYRKETYVRSRLAPEATTSPHTNTPRPCGALGDKQSRSNPPVCGTSKSRSEGYCTVSTQRALYRARSVRLTSCSCAPRVARARRRWRAAPPPPRAPRAAPWPWRRARRRRRRRTTAAP